MHTDDPLAPFLKKLPGKVASISPIIHEDALVAIVYKIAFSNGTEAILKIHKREGDFFNEWYFLKKFEDLIPVPPLLEIYPPEKNSPGAFLMEYLRGTLLSPHKLTSSLAFELGASLAKIHSQRLEGYGDLTQGSLNQDPRKYMTFKFEEGLKECEAHFPPLLIEKCRSFFAQHLPLLSAVDGPCVVHRDFRPGNLLVFEEKLQGILDWASARSSFAEEDFASVEEGNWLNEHHSSFLEGYRSVRTVPNYKPLLSFLYLNKGVALLGFLIKGNTWKKEHATLYAGKLEELKALVLHK